MKGGLNKLMRNITATTGSKTEFEKVSPYSFESSIETN